MVIRAVCGGMARQCLCFPKDLAAHSCTNFGKQRHRQLYDSSAATGFEVPDRARHLMQDFKSAALAYGLDTERAWSVAALSDFPHRGVGGLDMASKARRVEKWGTHPIVGKLLFE